VGGGGALGGREEGGRGRGIGEAVWLPEVGSEAGALREVATMSSSHPLSNLSSKLLTFLSIILTFKTEPLASSTGKKSLVLYWVFSF
jgi:hypothetical protein